jgi:hypothetical protein
VGCTARRWRCRESREARGPHEALQRGRVHSRVSKWRCRRGLHRCRLLAATHAACAAVAGFLLLKFLKEKLEDTLGLLRDLVKKDLTDKKELDVTVRPRALG